MKAIDWSLEEIFPAHGDLLDNLNHLFDEWTPILRRVYKSYQGLRYHRHQISRFRQRDRRAGTKWQTHIALQLFAIRYQLIERGKALQDMCGYDKGWLIRNCYPAGGKWKGSAYYDTPTGKQCRSPMCFWCWLRRFHDLRTLLCTPATQEVKMVSNRGRTQAGLGAGGDLCVTRYVCDAPELLDRRAVYDDFYKRVMAETRRPTVEGVTPGPGEPVGEFLAALRVTCPIRVKTHPGLQIAFIHQGAAKHPLGYVMPGTSDLSGRIEVYRRGPLAVEDALRLAFPFPGWLLEQHPAESYKVLIRLDRLALRTMGVIRLADPLSGRREMANPEAVAEPIHHMPVRISPAS